MIQANQALVDLMAQGIPQRHFRRVNYSQMGYLKVGDAVQVKTEPSVTFPACPQGTYTFTGFAIGDNLERTVLLLQDRDGRQVQVSPFHMVSVWDEIYNQLNDKQRCVDAGYDAVRALHFNTRPEKRAGLESLQA